MQSVVSEEPTIKAVQVFQQKPLLWHKDCLVSQRAVSIPCMQYGS